MAIKKKLEEREAELLVIVAQTNRIRANYVKEKINKVQQNSNCWLCRDRDERINPITSECSKFAQREFMTVWRRWSIENCARNWNLTTLPNGICTTSNQSWRIIWDSEMQTYPLIQGSWPDQEIIEKNKTKENLTNSWLCRPCGQLRETQRKRKDALPEN